MNPIPKRASKGPTNIIEPLKDEPFFLYFSDFKNFKSIFFAQKEYSPGEILETMTPKSDKISISLFTSKMSGMLEILTSSLVSNTAQRI